MSSNIFYIILAAFILPSQHTFARVNGNDLATNTAGKAQGMPVFRLLVFGDSISDTGNVFAASHNSLPDPEFYFRGRASDQFIWPDYLDASTNGSVQSWTITNYAFSTATACPSDGPEEFVLSVPEQVSNFLGGVPPPSPRGIDIQVSYDTVIILAGSNDYFQPLASLSSFFSGGESSSSSAQKLRDSIVPLPRRVVSCIMDSVYQLAPQFQKPTTLFVAGLPSLEKSPAFFANPMVPKVLAETAQAAISVATRVHNNLLKASISRFQSSRPDVQVKYLDFDGLLDSIDINKLGISVADQPCLQFKTIKPYGFEDLESTCKDPSKYLFYDPIHFTSSIHLELAKVIAMVVDR